MLSPGLCLNDIACRFDEPDSVHKISINVLCQYSLPNVPYTPVDLPQAWNWLGDAFILHEGEFLLSNNKLYQLKLKDGNLFIISVNIVIKK
jgi:hypothetical protein